MTADTFFCRQCSRHCPARALSTAGKPGKLVCKACAERLYKTLAMTEKARTNNARTSSALLRAGGSDKYTRIIKALGKVTD